MDKIIVSAPGKVIVFGEHAVVYGKQALAASLDLRTQLTINSNDENIINLFLPNININISWTLFQIEELASTTSRDNSLKNICHCADIEDLKKFVDINSVVDNGSTKVLAIVAFLHLFRSIILSNFKGKLNGINIEVTSLIPTSAGLGSSAAYSVCLAAGFLAYIQYLTASSHMKNSEKYENFDKELLDLINGWAFEAEKIIHGKPSGIDNSISTFGKAMWYKKGQFFLVENMPNLKVLLINTNIARNTKTLVEKVRLKRDKYPQIIEPLFESIEAISQSFKIQLDSNPNQEFYQDLMELISMNEQLLEILGVGHEAITKICSILKGYKLEGKLTGAGGGGCIFTIIPFDYCNLRLEELRKELTFLNYDSFITLLGGQGVKLHQ